MTGSQNGVVTPPAWPVARGQLHEYHYMFYLLIFHCLSMK